MRQRQTEYTGRVNVTTAVPVALGEAFDKLAEGRNTSKSALLKRLIISELKEAGMWPLPKK